MSYLEKLSRILESSEEAQSKIPLKEVSYALTEARKQRADLLRSRKRDAEKVELLTRQIHKLLLMRAMCHVRRGISDLFDQLLSARERVEKGERLDPFDFDYLTILEEEYAKMQNSKKKQ